MLVIIILIKWTIVSRENTNLCIWNEEQDFLLKNE